MGVDEYSSHNPAGSRMPNMGPTTRASAQHNPRADAVMDEWGGMGVEGHGLGGGADVAGGDDLERAIAASMEQNHGLSGASAGMTEDEQLARILEMSKNQF